jgi:hypothetical protein
MGTGQALEYYGYSRSSISPRALPELHRLHKIALILGSGALSIKRCESIVERCTKMLSATPALIFALVLTLPPWPYLDPYNRAMIESMG